MYNDVVERLGMFGYEIQEGDEQKINYSSNVVAEHIKNFCNLNSESLPTKFKYYAIDKICGDFLNTKFLTGSLEFNDIDFTSPLVKSISEGDTSVSYETGQNDSPSQKIKSFIDGLNLEDKNNLYRFRRFDW